MDMVGLSDLRRNFDAIDKVVVDPQSGIAEDIQHGLDEYVIKEARRNVWELFNTEGDFPSRIQTRKLNQFAVVIEVRAVYAAVHEYGGTFTITPRQRAFFWHKWAETEEPMWKALALSVTYTIPARPYMRPALDAYKGYAMAVAASRLAHRMEKAVKRS